MTTTPDYMEPLIGWRYWWLDPWAEFTHQFGYKDDGTSDDVQHAITNPVLQSFVVHGNGLPPPTAWPNDGPLVATCYCRAVGARLGMDVLTCASSPSDRDIDETISRYPCGIYAWRTLEWLLHAVREMRTQRGYVFGAVRLWGVIQPHERGYRAQYAYPDRIIYAAAGAAVARAVADYYRVPYELNTEVECEHRRKEAGYNRGTNPVARSGCSNPNCAICYPQPTSNPGNPGGASPSLTSLKAPTYWYSQPVPPPYWKRP